MAFRKLQALKIGVLLLVGATAGAHAANSDDLQKVILPYMQKYCMECHGEKAKKAGLDLRIYKDEVSMLKDMKSWQTLMHMVRDGEMPPEEKPQPKVEENQALLKAINGIFLRAQEKPDPGRVTIRRLNKVEYNNTVRDLLNVDFEPGEDFPSDEIGYGFDNIGDVLSLSPVLMERYLAAAETISQRSIMAELPKPNKRWQGAKYLEPSNEKVSQSKDKYRVMTSRNGAPLHETGPFHNQYQVPPDGEYQFRVRVFAQAVVPPGAKPAAPTAPAPQTAQKDEKKDANKPAAGTATSETKPAENKDAKAADAGKGEKKDDKRVAENKPAPAPGPAKPAKPVKIAILACGPEVPNPVSDAEAEKIVGGAVKGLRPFTVVKTFEVKGFDDKTAEIFEFKFGPLPFKRMALAMYKPEAGSGDVNLHVENFMLEGPIDPRPAFHRSICAPGTTPSPERLREVVDGFATRAYRRPVEKAELDGLMGLLDQVVKGGEKWEVAFQMTLQAILVSPKFLFRVELDNRPAGDDPRPINEFQLASRLSYFLWSTTPDTELMELAKKGQLTANIDAQVKRMLQSPKARSLVDNFAMQWLQIRRLESFAPDAQHFPKFNDRLRKAMMTETLLFVESVIKEDRSVLDLLAGDYSYVNETLARHYNIVDTVGNKPGQKTKVPGGKPIQGPQFVRVTFQNGERGGLLTHGSILTVTSNPTRTSPVKRGKWVLEQMLGTPPPPPPPDVPELSEEKGAELKGTLRQRMEQHRENPACANCHSRMDPIGFAFENFDGIGAYREKDGNFPIDSSGTMPDGKSFKGAGELKLMLKEKKEQFCHCLAEKLLTFALGRGLQYYDEPALKKIVAALEKNEFKFSVLAAEVAKSEPFRMRRGKETE